MDYRLQFIHCDKLFPTREEAIAYAKERRSNGDLTLYAEPMVLKYGETESTAHIILGIGANTNKTGYLEDNRICFIDIDHTEAEIEELHGELEAAIEALTIYVADSDTITLKKEEIDGKNTISGEVKLADKKVFGDRLLPNILTSSEDGLFTYVNLEYDEEHKKFIFTVNGDRKEIEIIQEPFVVGGYYDVTDESLHLTKNDGTEAVVALKELIGEWKTEGEASMTPVVLTKEEVAYDDGIHTSRHQDVLKGDVRIADDMPNNILEKVQNGRALYVNGSGANIKVWLNGHEVSIQEALESSSLCPVSSDYGNMIYKKQDGIFADSNLEYNEHENKLIFSKTNASGEVLRREIDLVGVEIFKDIWYDATREMLILQYRDNKGVLHNVEIPVGQLITEWDVRNGETNVTLAKTRNVAGQDLLTANANIASKTDFEDQILEERNHKLLVRGTALNIKYGDTNVKKALDNITSGMTALQNGLNDVDGKIGSGFTNDPHDNVTYKFEQLSGSLDALAQESSEAIGELTAKTAALETGLQDEILRATGAENALQTKIDNEILRSTSKDNELDNKLDSVSALDSSINVDGSDSRNPKIGVALDPSDRNIIKLTTEGLNSEVELDYNEDTNTLAFKVNGDTKEIPLAGSSMIEEITYDPTTEEIVFKYRTAGGQTGETRVSVSNIITEWDVENPLSGSAVELVKTEHAIDGHDKLSAKLIVSENPSNIASVVDNALFVDGSGIEAANAAIEAANAAIEAEAARAQAKEGELQEAIDAKSVTVTSTTTLSLSKNGEEISGNVKIANANENIIKADSATDGIYAKADLLYNAATNVLTFETTNGHKDIQLNAGSIIDGIDYDTTGENKQLVIRYHTTDGESAEVRVNVDDLFNEWIVQPGEHLGAIILEKDHEDDVDILRASVVISSMENNLLHNYDGALFVDGSGIQEAVDGVRAVTAQVASMQDEIDRIEAGAGLTQDGNYSPSSLANYINNATSLANATEKLDAALKNVEDAVIGSTGATLLLLNELSAKTVTEITSEDGSVIVSSATAPDGTVKYDLKAIGSAIDSIVYDSTTESLVITYTKSDGTTGSTTAPLGDLIEEYEFNSQEINTDNNVKFNVTRVVDGKTIVKADVDTFDSGEYEGVDR